MMQNWRHTDFKYVVEIQKGFVKQSSQSTLSPKVKKVSRVAIFLSIDDLSIFCRAKITTVPSWNCNRTSSPKLSYLSSDATAVRKMTTNGFQRNIIWKKPNTLWWCDFPLFYYCISIEYNQRSKIHLWKNSSMQIFKLEWILKRPKIWDFLVLIFTLLINLLELLWGPDIVGQRFPIEWHFPNSFDFSDLKKSPFVVHLVLL